MKTLHLSIILILLSGIVIPIAQNAISMPDLSPQDLYKQSDMVFYGQVISKQAEPNSDYYQIKVITYYKNPQTSDSITAAGHTPEGGHVSYPQFEVGDRAIFYITKLDGINTISPYSQKAGGACDVHSFLGPEYFGSPDVYRGGYASNPRLLDVNGNAIIGTISTNQKVVLSYDDIWNNYPQARAVPVKISIQNEGNGHYILNMTQNLQVQACDFAGNVKWNFVPTEIGNYIAKIDVENKTKMTYGFSVVSDATSTFKIIPSPLKQFKSGIAAKDVKCNQGLELLMKSHNGMPTCVKSTSIQRLLGQGWINPYDFNAVHIDKESISLSAYQGVSKEAFYNNGTVVSDFTINVNIDNFKPSNASLVLQVYYDDGTPYKTVTVSSESIQSDGFYKYHLITVSDKNHSPPFKVVATYNNETALAYAPVFAHP